MTYNILLKKFSLGFRRYFPQPANSGLFQQVLGWSGSIFRNHAVTVSSSRLCEPMNISGDFCRIFFFPSVNPSNLYSKNRIVLIIQVHLNSSLLTSHNSAVGNVGIFIVLTHLTTLALVRLTTFLVRKVHRGGKLLILVFRILLLCDVQLANEHSVQFVN